MRDAIKIKIRKLLDAEGYDGHGVPTVTEYDGFGGFLNDLETLPQCYRDEPGMWGSSNTWQGVINNARDGDDASGRAATELIDELSEQGLLAVGPSALGASVVGFTPIVPAYLAGHPESMLARVSHASNRSPIRVYMGIGAGGGVSRKQILDRGVAIVALVLGLSTVRPVHLYAWTANNPGNNHPSFRVWPVQSQPLDLPSAAYQICAADMHRVFGFSLARRDQKIQGAGGYPFPYGGNRDLIQKVARVAFECEDDDLVIPRAIHGDQDPLIQQPITWLKETIEFHKSGEALA